MSDGNPAKNAWAAAIELLREENALSNSQSAFVTMAQPLASVDDVFMIAVGSPFIKDKIEDHVAELMTERLSAILGRDVRLMISVDPSINEMPTVPPVEPELVTQSSPDQPYAPTPGHAPGNSLTSSSFETVPTHSEYGTPDSSRFDRRGADPAYPSAPRP